MRFILLIALSVGVSFARGQDVDIVDVDIINEKYVGSYFSPIFSGVDAQSKCAVDKQRLDAVMRQAGVEILSSVCTESTFSKGVWFVRADYLHNFGEDIRTVNVKHLTTDQCSREREYALSNSEALGRVINTHCNSEGLRVDYIVHRKRALDSVIATRDFRLYDDCESARKEALDRMRQKDVLPFASVCEPRRYGNSKDVFFSANVHFTVPLSQLLHSIWLLKYIESPSCERDREAHTAAFEQAGLSVVNSYCTGNGSQWLKLQYLWKPFKQVERYNLPITITLEQCETNRGATVASFEQNKKRVVTSGCYQVTQGYQGAVYYLP